MVTTLWSYKPCVFLSERRSKPRTWDTTILSDSCLASDADAVAGLNNDAVITEESVDVNLNDSAEVNINDSTVTASHSESVKTILDLENMIQEEEEEETLRDVGVHQVEGDVFYLVFPNLMKFESVY